MKVTEPVAEELEIVAVRVVDAPKVMVEGEAATEVVVGRGLIVKFTPLLGVEFTFTTTLPVVAPVGTGTTILLALQLVGIAVTPLKVTELPPWLDPKFDPLIVTTVPTAPDVGDTLVILG